MTNPAGTNPEGAGPTTGPSYPGSPYQSQTTYQLQNIDFTKFPVTDKNFIDNITRLNSFADYVSKYLLTMQEGIDQSQEDTIAKIQGFATNLVQLFGNGSLLFGINLGDLQYYLPALGALFGFNQTDPFPINLFDAAEQFFLGYVVPLDSFSTTIDGIIDAFLEGLGIDADFITSVNNLVSAFQSLAISAETFVNDVASLLSIFGVTSGEFGPFSDLWNAVTQLLGGNGLQDLSNTINPIFHALAPWVNDVAIAIQDLDDIINAFGLSFHDVTAIANFASMFTGILNFLPGATTNQLTNPGITGSASNWDITPMSDVIPGGGLSDANFNPSYNGSVGDTAAGCIEFNGTGNSWCTNTDLMAVNAGDTVQGIAHFSYSDLGTPGGAGSPFVTAQIAEYTDVDPISGPYTLLRYIAGKTVTLNGSNSGWTEVATSSSYVVSSDATNVAIMFVVYMPNGGIIYADDFSLIDSSLGTFDVLTGWTSIFSNFLGPLGTAIGNLLSIPASLLSGDNSQNMLTNPTLVSSANNWTLNSSGMDFEPTWNDAYGYDGGANQNGSLQFSGDVHSWALSELVQVTAAQPVTGSAYYTYSAVGSSASIILEFDEYDSSSTFLRTIGATTETVSGSDSTWTQVSTNSSYVASSDAAYVALRPTVSLGSGGTAWFSAFSVTKGGGLQDSLVPGIGNIITTIITALGGSGTTYSELSSILAPIASVVSGFGGVVDEVGTLATDVSNALGDLLNIGSFFGGGGTPNFSNISSWFSLPVSFLTGILSLVNIPNLPASQITSGTFAASLLQPVIDAISQGFGGSSGLNFTTLESFLTGLPTAQALADAIYQAINGGSSTGNAVSAIKTALENIPGANIISTLAASVIPSLSGSWGGTIASSLLSGAIAQGIIPSLTSGWGGTIASSLLSGVLSQGLIPSLTSGWGGTIAGTLISGITTIEQNVVDYIYQAINGGNSTGNSASTVKTALQNIPGANIISALAASVIPSLTSGWGGSIASSLLSGMLVSSIIPSLTGSWAGTIAGSLLTGSVAASLISGITTNEQAIADYIYQAIHGGTSTGNALSTVKTSLTNIPGANIVSALAASVIPSLSGSWGGTIASSLLSGVLSQGLIPTLTGSWGGTIAASLMSGVLGTGNIPNLPASIITSGTFVTSLIPNITAAMSTDLQGLIDDVTNAPTGGSTTGNPASAAASAIQGIFTGVYNNITGALTSVATQSQANAAISSLAATTAANSAAVASLQSQQQQSSSGGGIAEVFSFAGYSNATTLPAAFTETAYGTGGTTVKLGITSGCAALQWPNTVQAPEGYIAEYNISQSLTDYQLITGTFPTAPSWPGSGSDAWNYLYGRMNSGGTTYVFAAIGYDTVKIGCVVSGTTTTFTTATTSFQAGATYSLVCGTSGGVRAFQLLCNGAPILSYTDSGGTSQYGSTYRYAGFGMYGWNSSGYTGTPGTIYGANIPGVMSQWTFSDNTPLPTVGSGAHIYRTSTSTVNISSGQNTLPTSFYGNTLYATNDITVNLTNNKFTVTYAGWYLVNICYQTVRTTAPEAASVSLYHNGSLAQQAGGGTGNGAGSTQYPYLYSGAFLIYLAAGDYVTPGYISSQTESGALTGESTGSYSYMNIALVNRSLS